MSKGAKVVMGLLLLMSLASCSGQQEAATPKSEPHGRYMMLNGPDGGVYVLDTAKGFFRFCQPRSSKMDPRSDGTELEVECGAGVSI